MVTKFKKTKVITIIKITILIAIKIKAIDPINIKPQIVRNKISKIKVKTKAGHRRAIIKIIFGRTAMGKDPTATGSRPRRVRFYQQ